jgi:hypothetical protein
MRGTAFILDPRMAIVGQRIDLHQCHLKMRSIENGAEGLEGIQSSNDFSSVCRRK